MYTFRPTLIFACVLLLLINSCAESPFQQKRFKTRIVSANNNTTTTELIRTYDLALNELKKEERFYPNGQKQFEGLFDDNKPVEDSPLLWWFYNGQIHSIVFMSKDLQVINVDIWYENGMKQFSLFGNSYTWWNKNGIIILSGNLYDSSVQLPILSENGKVLGIRTAFEKNKRIWIEDWELYNDQNETEFAGEIKCTLISKESVYREPMGSWINTQSGKEIIIKDQMQNILDERTAGFEFVLIQQMEKDLVFSSDGVSNHFRILNGKRSKLFKSRQFKRVYELELNDNGSFIHSWPAVTFDGEELQAGYSGGRFVEDSLSNAIVLHFDQGLHAGEAHEIIINSHRELKYPFRGNSYFLR